MDTATRQVKGCNLYINPDRSTWLWLSFPQAVMRFNEVCTLGKSDPWFEDREHTANSPALQEKTTV